MEEWKDGRMEEWKSGRLEGWKIGTIIIIGGKLERNLPGLQNL